MDKKAYDLWLYSLSWIGRKTCIRLWKEGYSSQNIYQGECDFSMLNEKQKNSIFNGRKIPEEEIKKDYEKLEQKGMFMTSFGDDDYPERFYEIPDAPAMLFWKGKLPVQNQKSIAVIGARNCSEYGISVAKRFAECFAKNQVSVISGMARGIDGIAQKTTLQQGGYSIAVLGCGVNVCYPPEHRMLYTQLSKVGCVLSEYLPDEKAAAHYFPARNRLISGLADALLVIEAKEKSGTLITVEMALEQGKEVYVVPGRIDDIFSQGCNRLLYEGANLAISPEKMLFDIYGMDTETKEKKESSILGSVEEKILSVLESTPIFIDEIQKRTQFKDEVLMNGLINLILLHKIKQACNGWYCKI